VRVGDGGEDASEDSGPSLFTEEEGAEEAQMEVDEGLGDLFTPPTESVSYPFDLND
jgi:hypothetical protein